MISVARYAPRSLRLHKSTPHISRFRSLPLRYYEHDGLAPPRSGSTSSISATLPPRHIAPTLMLYLLAFARAIYADAMRDIHFPASTLYFHAHSPPSFPHFFWGFHMRAASAAIFITISRFAHDIRAEQLHTLKRPCSPFPFLFMMYTYFR